MKACPSCGCDLSNCVELPARDGRRRWQQAGTYFVHEEGDYWCRRAQANQREREERRQRYGERLVGGLVAVGWR